MDFTSAEPPGKSVVTEMSVKSVWACSGKGNHTRQAANRIFIDLLGSRGVQNGSGGQMHVAGPDTVLFGRSVVSTCLTLHPVAGAGSRCLMIWPIPLYVVFSLATQSGVVTSRVLVAAGGFRCESMNP